MIVEKSIYMIKILVHMQQLLTYHL